MKKITRTSAYASLIGAALVLLMPVLLGGTRGDSADALSGIYFVVVIATAVAISVALATWTETQKRPGATPLIYGVIAIPVGAVLFFVMLGLQLVMIAFLGLIAFATGIVGVIIGIVKKLSVHTVTTSA